MAQRTRPAAETSTQEIGGFTVERLTTITHGLVGSVRATTHPVNAPTAAAAANNILAINEIITIMGGSQPAAGTPQRAVWDAALREWESASSALEGLRGAQATLISRLSRMDIAGVSEEARPRLARVLGQINARIYDSGYEPYVQYANVIVTMSGSLGGEATAAAAEAAPATAPGTTAVRTATAAPAQQEGPRPAGLESIPPWRRNLSRHGTMRPLGFQGDTMVMAYQTSLTNEIRDAYGCTVTGACPAGANAINLVADGFSYRAQGQDMTASRAADLARQIGTALGGVRSGHSLREDAKFTQAVQAFNEGRLNDGLNLLQQSTSFNGTLLPALGQVHSITVNAEAITLLHAGAMVEIPLTGRNRESMRAWLARAREDSEFAVRLGYLAVGMYYQLLRISGQDIVAGRTRAWDTLGHVIGFNTELGFGAIVNRTPLEIILHASFDFTNWEHSLAVPRAGGTTSDLTIGQNWDFSVSLFGIEVRTPAGVTGERQRIDLDAIGIAGTATGLGEVGSGEARRPEGAGPALGAMLYAQFSGEWYRGDQWSVHTQVMPQVRYLLSEVRTGGRIDLIQVGYNMRDHMIGFGAGIGVETAVYNADTNEWGGRTRTEYYGTFGYSYAPWGLSTYLRGGAISDWGVLGGGAEHAPAFTFNVALDDRLFSRQPRERGEAAAVVPSRVARIDVALPADVATAYNSAVTDALVAPDAAARARSARSLGTALRGWTQLPASTADASISRLASSREFTLALGHLDAGRLTEGLAALRRISAFSSLTSAPSSQPRGRPGPTR